MATEIKFRRGTTAQHSTFTGAAGEVTVDTDKKTLVVHDGVTPGGQPLPTTTTNIPSDNSVSTTKIQDNAVTNDKMADNSVNTTEIVDNAITTAKIINDAVTLDKIADASFANQSEAEAGVDNTKLMTPLRTRQQGVARDAQWLRAWDQKTTGTEGGSSSIGVNVRVLNQSEISITGASLSSNQITLPAGTYEITARVPSFNSSRTKAYLRTAGGTLLVNGGSSFSGGGNAEVNMHIQGRFTLEATTAVEIVMNCSGFQSTTGLGNAGNASGIPEIYTDVMIWKVD